LKKSKANSLRKFGIELVDALPWGTHLCQFYESKQDLIDILVPYFAAGLRSNEFCMWITSPPLEVAEATEALRKVVPDLNVYLDKGQIEIISYDEWYLLGGEFDAKRVMKGWVKKEQAALKRSFAGLRLTGNTLWVERDLWKSFVDYEEAVNSVIGEHKMIAVCTYCLTNCTGTDVLDVIRNHIGTLVKQGDKWFLIEDAARRKAANGALKLSERKYSALFENMQDGFAYHKVLFDEKGKPVDYVFLEINEAFERLTGLKRENILGKAVTQVLPGIEKEPANWIGVYGKVALTGKPARFENYAEALNRWYMVSAYAPEKGYFAATFEDITERKKEEAIFREQSLVISSVSDAIFSTDNYFIFRSWNKSAERMFGWKAEEVIGKASTSIFQIVYPTLQGVTREEALNDLMNAGFWKGEVLYHTKDGSSIAVHASISLVKGQNGSVLGTVTIVHDITARKKREEALREIQRDLTHAQAVGKIGSWRMDVKHNVLLWSDENHRIFGIPKGTPMTYETFLSTVHPGDRKYVDRKWQAGLRGEPYDIEHRIIVDGEVKWVHEKAELEFDKDGTLMGGFGTTQEITDLVEMRKKLEKSRIQLEEYSSQMQQLANERAEKLKDAERLAAIGATAGMVGHDIRNPLQAIAGDLYLITSDLASVPEGEEKESMKESVKDIAKNVEYIDKIVQDLQDYAKPLKPTVQETDLEELCDEILFKNEVPDNIEVSYKAEEAAKKIVADPTLLKRILSNLTNNAVQAMPDGGKLEIKAYKDADDFVITVRDTGVGIPEEVKPNIFTPLFTTKSKGQGFGLAVVKRMTEALGGRVTFESKEGTETTFTVRIPQKTTNNK
jgi:PAS domain S-box-containing protein